MSHLISYEEALERLLKGLPAPSVETVALTESLGRVLARPVFADMDLPPFDKAVMDGYAVRAEDARTALVRLRVVGESFAGGLPQRALRPGEAFQVMTGAPVPAGADAVQIVEKSRRIGPEVELLEAIPPGANLASRGHEVKQGDEVLAAGQPLGPAQLGVLATFGMAEVEVYERPCVHLVATGSELVAPEQMPGPGQIRNSNLVMLEAQSRRLGCRIAGKDSVGDDEEKTRRLLKLEADILIFSGGVSMGERDYVHRVVKESGADLIFHKAAIKPGKPVLFARRGCQLIFGLPGNPVSCFVTFELFVRPAVRSWMGFTRPNLRRVQARLSREVVRKAGRRAFMAARVEEIAGGCEMTPLETRGSADLVAFSRANALLIVPPERSRLERGARVAGFLLESFFEEGGAV